MAGMEAEDVASTLNRLGGEERVRSGRCSWAGRRKNGSIVVLKDHSVLVGVILLTTGTSVSGTEIALWVILWEIGLLGRLCLTEPWPLCAMGRDENVLAGEGIHFRRVQSAGERDEDECERTAAMGMR